MEKERTLLKVIFWLLMAKVLWLVYFLGNPTKSLDGFVVSAVSLAITILCLLLIVCAVANGLYKSFKKSKRGTEIQM